LHRRNGGVCADKEQPVITHPAQPRSLPAHHEAIDRVSGHYARATADAAGRSRAAARLGELCWARYWLVRYGADIDVARSLAEVQRLLDRILPLVAAPREPSDLVDARLVAGLAFLERWELTGEPADLDRGIDLLAVASIWDLPATDRRRCQAGAELVGALRQQAMIDNRPAVLDRAVTTALRTLAKAGPADGMAWLCANYHAARAAHDRWRVRRAGNDLEFAHRCWQPLLAHGLRAWSAREYQALLADRGAS
jgi:hypothetical protein